jgi:hypothetical protein
MPERTNSPSIREFVRVIWEDWGSRVSGALSIPFTVLALFAKADYARIIWACLAVIGVVATIYQVWSKERKRVVQLEESLSQERQKNTPELIGAVEQIIVGECFGVAEMIGVFLNLTIINRGADSTVRNWKASVTVSGMTREMSLSRIADNTRFVMENGQECRINSSDGIYDKIAVAPIRRGTHVSGWIHVTLEGLGLNTTAFRSPGSKLSIGFEDFLGKNYVAEYVYTGQPAMAGPLYVPGSGGPLL